ncbi:MAG TPA: hypothetical protein VMM37_06110, partial [Bacteroidota bacterium]|nr:hypothetical protein [Bacteroidota bacterium]
MTILEAATGTLPDHRRLFLILWAILAVLIMFIDYVMGPYFQFPFLFILPVVFSTWYNGRWWGYVYAVVLPLCRLYLTTIWTIPWTIVESSINALIRISVLSLLAYLVGRIAVQTRAKEKEVKMLEGLLPICASCKKIRDESGEWQVLEAYITGHSGAKFSHGVCPDCAKKLYGL